MGNKSGRWEDSKMYVGVFTTLALPGLAIAIIPIMLSVVGWLGVGVVSNAKDIQAQENYI